MKTETMELETYLNYNVVAGQASGSELRSLEPTEIWIWQQVPVILHCGDRDKKGSWALLALS